jgi:ATP-dependent Clp protease ATP-binding subunit ClpB
MEERLLARHIRVKLTQKALAHLLAACAKEPHAGARSIRRVVQEHLESPLANKLVSGAWKKKKKISVDVAKNTLTYTASA